jgi:hypothetical protein
MKTDKVQKYIWWLLLNNDAAVEDAMLELYQQQTEDEKTHKATYHRNARGFSSAEAKIGTYLAGIIIDGYHLKGIHLDRARHLVLNHYKQISIISQNFLMKHGVDKSMLLAQ